MGKRKVAKKRLRDEEPESDAARAAPGAKRLKKSREQVPPSASADDAGYDVIIVGAGLSGLACALELESKGISYLIVEGRSVVGGRARGANFIHGEHVTTWKYLKRFGLEADGSYNGWAVPPKAAPSRRDGRLSWRRQLNWRKQLLQWRRMRAQRDGRTGECWVYVDGELRGPKRVHSEPYRLFFGKLEELGEEWIEAGHEDISMLELAEKKIFAEAAQQPTEDERRLMKGQMAEWHAADLADVGVYEDDLSSSRIKALAEKRPALVSEDGDEGHWRIIGSVGHEALAQRMAQNLKIKLDSPVERVTWKDDRVSVQCKGSKTFTAKAAVVTLPLACIPDVHFEPPLPQEKQVAVKKLGCGVTTQVFLRFKERFWPEKMAFLFHSMPSQCFWPAFEANTLITYFGGAEANAQMLHLSDDAMIQEIVRQLGVIFSRKAADLGFISGNVVRWDTDPFAKMSYSYCPVGTSALRSDLQKICGNLIWAGEATHPTKASYVHGALESGEFAAEEALKFLGK